MALTGGGIDCILCALMVTYLGGSFCSQNDIFKQKAFVAATSMWHFYTKQRPFASHMEQEIVWNF